MNAIQYLLLFKGNSDAGGTEASVRGFIKLESAQAAMLKSYKKYAAALHIPVSPSAFGNPYTIKAKNSIHLNRNGDFFHWEIIQAVPEDAEPNVDSELNRPRGLTNYTVTIEEHIAQEFPVRAYSIFDAVRSAEQKYNKGVLVVQPSVPNTRLISARDDETGEMTEWKEF